MNIGLLIRLFLCIMCLGCFLYAYIKEQNVITKLRLQIPVISHQLELAQQENTRLQFEIDQFENPVHLMEILRRPEYGHLKHPLVKDVLTISIPREPKVQK